MSAAQKTSGAPEEVEKTAAALAGDAAKTAAALQTAFAKADDPAALWLISLTASKDITPFLLAHYSSVLDSVGSKKGPIKFAARAAFDAVTAVMPIEAAPLELEALYKGMDVQKQWPTRVAALDRAAALCAAAPEQVASCLPSLVPVLSPCLWDTKKEVAASSKACVEAAFRLCGNKDIEGVIPKLVAASVKPIQTSSEAAAAVAAARSAAS